MQLGICQSLEEVTDSFLTNKIEELEFLSAVPGCRLSISLAMMFN
jgi:hypothetical protein